MSSKAAKRKKAFEERVAKRNIEKKRIENYNRVLRDPNSDIGDLAKVMGIPLK